MIYSKWVNCCNLSCGVALNVWFTTNGMCAKNNNLYMWHEQAIIEWSRRVISIAACCHGAKLCANAARDFRSQHNYPTGWVNYSSSVLVDSTQQLQALALQQAVWGISCLVLLPSSCNDSSLHPPFSNNNSSHCCDFTIIVDSTNEHFCKTPEMSITDELSHWNKAWAEAKCWI